MPRKQKPKKHWDGGGFYNFPYLLDDDFKRIATALRVDKINEKIRSEIQEAVRHYFVDKDYIPSIPKPGEVKAALRLLRSRAKAFIDCLEELDAVSLEVLARTSAFPNTEIYDLVDGKSDCYKIHSSATEALEKLKKDKGGHPRTKDALQNFIVRLKAIFEEVKKSKASVTFKNIDRKFQGAFYDFAKECLEQIDPDEIWSNSSLGQQIKASLKLKRLP